MTLQASVIIPTFDDWHVLQKCLDCLANQSLAQERFEVIVANNNPSAEVPSTLKLSANTRVIHAVKPGSYATRNVAIKEVRADVLFFTDSDCQPDERWIEAGLAALAPLGPTGRVAGAVELFSASGTWTGPELYERVNSFRQQDYTRIGWGVTANLVVRRAVFEFVGPFPEDRFSGGDRVWNMQATAMGCELAYCPEVVVRHPTRASFADLSKKRKRLTGGRHCDEVEGLVSKQNLVAFVYLLQPKDARRIMSYPGLTDLERLKVLWVTFRLGFIMLFEIFRLRYLSGIPARS